MLVLFAMITKCIADADNVLGTLTLTLLVVVDLSAPGLVDLALLPSVDRVFPTERNCFVFPGVLKPRPPRP